MVQKTDEPPAPQQIALGIDLGSDRSVSSLLVGPPFGQPTLVRNNLSNDSTPTAVAFGSNFKRCVGDEALEQPASNAANIITDLPKRLGASGPVSVGYGADGAAETFSLEHCLAMYLSELTAHAAAQRGGAAPTHTVISCPQAYTAAQHRAVADAARIAGIPNVSLAPSCSALAFHYAERHGGEAFPPPPGEGEGADASAPRLVLLVDVGCSYGAAAVAAYHADRSVRVLSSAGTDEVGGGVADEVLMAHFREQLSAKHGAGASGPKFEHRLRRACEKLKKLLSTVEQARVDADSLVPDADVALSLSRKELEGLLRPQLEALGRVIAGALEGAGPGAAESLVGVEVVGGGARVPCVLEAVRQASGQPQTKHTLDSSAAVAFGAAGMAKLFLSPQKEGGGGGGEEEGGGEGGVDKGGAGPRMEGAFVEPGAGGLGEEAVAAAAAREALMREEDARQREAQDARNRLEEWVYGMRSALDGRSGHLLERPKAEAMLDGVEEWLWGEGEGLGAGGYSGRLAEVEAEARAAFPAFFAEEERLRGEEEAREKEEEVRRRKEEEDNKSSEDHDNRILKFAERFAMAEKNKAEGNELFKDGNCKFAAERYVKALGHLAKLVHVEGTMKEGEHAQAKALKIACYSNVAQCFLRLEAWSKAADNCSQALELDGANAKALFRRAQARFELKELELAAADCRGCLEVNPGDKAVEKLLERCDKGIKAAEAKQKKMYGKMFG